MRNSIPTLIKNATTVKALRDMLADFADDDAVLVVSDYGDHCHTQQAVNIETVDELEDAETLYESGYSHSGVAVRNVYDETEDDEELDREMEKINDQPQDWRRVVLLRIV